MPKNASAHSAIDADGYRRLPAPGAWNPIIEGLMHVDGFRRNLDAVRAVLTERGPPGAIEIELELARRIHPGTIRALLYNKPGQFRLQSDGKYQLKH